MPPAGTLRPRAPTPGPSRQVKLKGTWSTYKTKHSPTGKGRTSTKKSSTATAKVWGHGLVLTFDRSAKAGKVKVTVDGKSTTLDLYSKAGKPLSKTWTFSGALKTAHRRGHGPRQEEHPQQGHGRPARRAEGEVVTSRRPAHRDHRTLPVKETR